MAHALSRRSFVTGLSATAAYTMLPPCAFAFAPSGITFGYAAITWGDDTTQAIKEIAELGFRGVQLRANVVQKYGERPAELRDLLAQNRLEMVALSSGNVRVGTATDAEEIAKHTRHAEFVRAVGGRYLQIIDRGRSQGKKPEAAEFKQLGRLLTEIGKRAGDIGVPVGYHNHLDSIGEAPDEIDRVMDAADSRHVKLLLDIAHYQQGGGDPVRAIKQYGDRLLFLHIKDVETITDIGQTKADGKDVSANTTPARLYRFVELGRGRVNLPSVFDALKDVKYRGWAVVELDGVPDKSRTAKECAAISKRYIEEKLKLKI